MPGNESQIHDWSIVVLHEGYTSTLKILEGGFKHLYETYGIRHRVVKFTEDSNLSIGANEIPLLIRSASPWIASFATKLTEVKKPFIYFIDDDFWSISLKTDLGKFYRNPSTLLAMQTIITQAALVITNTEILASRIRKFTRKIQVFPAYFDFSLVDKYANLRRKVPNESSKIRIGFASNVSRIDDLKMIEGPLLCALSKYPDLEVDVIGLMPVALSGHASVNVFPYMNSYEEYIAFQMGRQWDIGLAPLLPSKQAASKTNNKFREYSAMGIAGIYSDEAPYKEVRNFENGVLAKPNPKAWESALFTLIENSDLRTQVSLKANSEVREKYDISHIMKLWVEAIEPVAASNPPICIDWSRGEVSHKVPKFHYALFALRTRGPVVVWRHYSRRVWELAKSRFDKLEIDPDDTVGALIEGSEWHPPKNRFTDNQPSTSIIAIFNKFTSIQYVSALLDSVSRQSLSDFEFIIVANNVDTAIEKELQAFWDTNSNIGLTIASKDGLNLATLFVQGYLKSRAESIVFLNEGVIPNKHALEELYKYSNSKEESSPKILLSSRSQGLFRNQRSSIDSSFTVATGDNPFIGRIITIPRAVIEQVGLFDPHILSSGLYEYDFWNRTVKLFDYVELSGLLDEVQTKRFSSNNHQNVEFLFPQLIWLEQDRSQQLSPRGINKYSTTYVDKSLGGGGRDLASVLNRFEAKNSLGLAQTDFARQASNSPALKYAAIVSKGENSQVERFFRLTPDWEGLQFVHIKVNSENELDRISLAGSNAVIWVDELALSNCDDKPFRNIDIPQYGFLSTPSSIEEHLALISKGATARSRNQRIFIAPAHLDYAQSLFPEGTEIVPLPRNYRVSKHSLHIPSSKLRGTEIKVLLFADKERFNRYFSEIRTNLSQLAQSSKQKITLMTFTDSNLSEVRDVNNDYFRISHLEYTDDFNVMVRRLRNEEPDLLVFPEIFNLENIERTIFFEPVMTGAFVGAIPINLENRNSSNELSFAINLPNPGELAATYDWATLINKMSADPNWIQKIGTESVLQFAGKKREKQNQKIWKIFLETYVQTS